MMLLQDTPNDIKVKRHSSIHPVNICQSLLGNHWLSAKESACIAKDADSIPGLGRSPGGGNGNPLQYSCRENPLDRGACRAIVCGVSTYKDIKQNGLFAPGTGLGTQGLAVSK